MKYLTKLVSFLVVLVLTNQSISQNFGECGVGNEVRTEVRATDCSNSSTTWLNNMGRIKIRRRNFYEI